MTINYVAVVVAAIAGYAVGALWYSPVLFGKVWMRLMEITPEKMEANKGKSMGKMYAIGFVGTLLMSYVLAHFVGMALVADISGALQLGFWLWLGFIATVLLGSVLYESRPWKLYFINAAHYLVALLVMAIILGLWK